MDINSEIPADLSRLMIALEEVLNASSKSKKTLSVTYENTKKLLDDWHIPDTFSHQEPGECTCDVDNEESVSDVTRNIEEIVEKAQKLREKWNSSSQIQPKKMTVTQSASKSYISPKSVMKHPAYSTTSNDTVIKKVNDKFTKKTETCSSNKQTFTNSNSEILTDHIDAKKTESKLPVSKKFLNAKLLPQTSFSLGNSNKKSVLRPQSKSTSSLRTTYQKDFAPQVRKSFKYPGSKGTHSVKPKEISEKNDSVRTLKNPISSSVKDKQSDSKNPPFVFNSAKMTELEELLDQVTIYPNLAAKLNSEKIEEPQIKASSCMLHCNTTVQSCKKNYRLVGLEEAIDVLGVPPELVKVLKTYHSFLSVKSSCITSKGQSSAKSFAKRLSESNDSRLRNTTYEPLVIMFLDYMALINELSVANNYNCLENGRINLTHFKKKSEELEIKIRKLSNVDESVISNTKLLCQRTKEHHKANFLRASVEGWDMMGIWYRNSSKRAQALKKLKCIRYSSRDEWKKFDANMQSIQRMEFQLEIFDILEKTVFPQLLSIYRPQDSTFVALFKTACTLCNMNLLIPPLVIKSS